MNSIALVTGAISGFGHAVGTGSECVGQLAVRAHRAGQSRPARSISSCPIPSWFRVRSAYSLRRESRLLRPR